MGDGEYTTGAEPRDAELAPVSANGVDEALATPDEAAAFQLRFLRLLERRTAIHTMGDSTSVPRHVAADLLRSICFVLGIDPDRPEVPRSLLSVDLEDEYRRRVDALGRRVDAAEKLWRDVCARMPLIENIALRDTLKNLGDFFTWYDYRSMAHETPVMIDYPLCHPVPETLQGIDYIEEYLRRLMIEAEFLARLEVEAIERVLRASAPDHIELLINLYEPVATNAIGLALAGKNLDQLVIAEPARIEIESRLRGPAGRRGRVLQDAAGALCNHLSIESTASRAYLSDLVPDLLARIEVSLPQRALRGVFVG